MSFRYCGFVVVIFSLSISHAIVVSSGYNNEKQTSDYFGDNFEDLHEGSTCEDKILAALKLTTSNNHMQGGNCETFDKLEKNINIKIDTMETKLLNSKYNISYLWDSFDKEILEQREENFKLKINAMNIKFDKILNKLDGLDKINKELEENKRSMQKKVSELELNINKRLDVMQFSAENILAEVHENRFNVECKRSDIKGDNYMTFWPMNSKSLNHTTVKNDLAGLSYFEILFAVKGNGMVYIAISSMPTILNDASYFQIGFNTNKTVVFQNRVIVLTKDTPEFSSTQFAAFYLKVNNGTLEFGEKGSPSLTYSDENLKHMKYFSFGGVEGEESNIYYDCPH